MYTNSLIEKWGDELNVFLNKQEYVHLWQSPLWYELRKNSGSEFYTVVVKDGNTIKSIAQFAYFTVMRRFKYCYVSGGPVWEDGNNEALESVMKFIMKHAQQQNSIFIKIDPMVRQYSPVESKILLSMGAQNAVYKVKPRGAALVNLQGDFSTYFSTLKKSTRYSIRVAEKNNIQIVRGVSEKDFDEYDKIIRLTESRQNFKQRDSQFFLNMLKMYSFEDPFFLLLAKHEDKVIAGGIFIKYQNRLHYLAGGHDQNFSKMQAPSKLQIEAMKLAKEKNCSYYDFFSYSLGEEKQFTLVDKFKLSFNPEIIEWEYPKDIVLNKALYLIYKFIH